MSSKHDSAQKGMDHGANQDWWGVRNDEKVDELDMVGYIDMNRQFVGALNCGDNDEEKKKGFLKWNTGQISLRVFWGV